MKPSVKAPNHEVNLADIGISSTNYPTGAAGFSDYDFAVDGSWAEAGAACSGHCYAPSAQPTPTAVMSISDLRMPDGTATLPPVNETTEQSESGTLAPGQASAGKSISVTGAGALNPSRKLRPAWRCSGTRNGTRPG